MAFTDYEAEQLHKALLKETRRCAVTLGMKKTSLDKGTQRKTTENELPSLTQCTA